MPEHKAYLLKHETAMRYTDRCASTLTSSMKREREKSRQRTQAKTQK